MSEIKHTMPDVIYAELSFGSDDIRIDADTYPFLSRDTSYTRTDIVQGLVDIIEQLMPLELVGGATNHRTSPGSQQVLGFCDNWLVTKPINPTKARELITKAQQALNKAKGLGDDTR